MNNDFLVNLESLERERGIDHETLIALVEESLVVTYWDPYAIINLPLPCGANDEILHVNTNTVPPYQTPVTMHFTPRD